MQSPQPPPWTAHRRESDKGSVGARGASAAGMVCCWQIAVVCRSYLVLNLDSDESKLDTFRDSREGQQRAPVFLPQAQESY